MTDYTKLLAALRNNDWSDACPCCDEAMCKDADCIILQAADAIEALQAEVKRLKECNDELREAQTYIDHYGDKWMTSAKDVPTSAYNHGYMDGKNEAEQALEPKRGEWLNVTDSYHWYGKCSVCGEEFVVDAYYAGGMNYCPNCGAKMEVQE